ncbi:MAG TPA: bifunctional phosphopantothenoylcysteine decarboxylase/phosphopantothenate--cysteine ligase CoaBC [Chloroflexota bacterium]|nr:bifunctional phosphopantothenoylcysteine decarboxylase/phosphopantothenate--cysteine ligase CoaBC [Chloroflexota bacterium]
MRVLLGVSGSIAAFKAAAIAGELVRRGHDVRVILTTGGSRFVAPATFQGITGHSVAISLWDDEAAIEHLDLAHWAEVLAVAPASAGAIARLALGLTSDVLGATALAFPGPVVVAPAMETAMWRHPATIGHMAILRDRGAVIVGPETGRLASGAEGEGRMAEPLPIVDAIEAAMGTRDLEGRRVLVTAGPTYEALDDVRFIGNRSSGKMGFAVASEARDRGAQVTVVAGPTAVTPPDGVELVRVETHQQMRDVVVSFAPRQDVVVMAAAVADFRPASRRAGKIARGDSLRIELEGTRDIAAEAVTVAPHAVHVGFALETEDLEARARDKLRRKGQHLVVANAVAADRSPFGADTNRVALVTENGVERLPEMSKRQVARILWDRIVPLLDERDSVDHDGAN